MNYIIFDLECTCWRGRPPGMIQEIIEIGAVMIDDYGDELDQFSAFVKPVVNPQLSFFCTELTTITQTQVNQAKTFEVVGQRFMDWVGVGFEPFHLVSWGDFDKHMMAIECERYGFEHAWTKQHSNLKDQYRLLRKMKNGPGLARVIEDEGFLFEGMQHRAISDAINTAKIYNKFLGNWNF